MEILILAVLGFGFLLLIIEKLQKLFSAPKQKPDAADYNKSRQISDDFHTIDWEPMNNLFASKSKLEIEQRLPSRDYLLRTQNAGYYLTIPPLLYALDSDEVLPGVASKLFSVTSKFNLSDETGFSTIHGACKAEEFLDILTYCLDKGVSPNLPIDNEMGFINTPIGFAVRFRNLKGVERLLQRGADPTAYSNWAVKCWSSIRPRKIEDPRLKNFTSMKAFENEAKTLLLLTKAGANLNEFDFRGNNALHELINTIQLYENFEPNLAFPANYFEQKLNLLIECGSDPDAFLPNSHYAIRPILRLLGYQGNYIKILLNNGAKIDFKTDLNNTILHSFAGLKSVDVDLIKWLLDHSDYNRSLTKLVLVRNADGENPSDILTKNVDLAENEKHVLQDYFRFLKNGKITQQKTIDAPSELHDDHFYSAALMEFNSGAIQQDTYTKAMTLCAGNENEAKWEYVRIRVAQMKHKN